MAEKVDGFSFIWKLENYSMLPHQAGKKLVSQTFVVEKFKGVEFCLHLYPKGAIKKGDISLYLIKEPIDLKLKLNFSLVLESTKPSKEVVGTIESNGILEDGLGFSKLVSLREIFANKELYLPQDTLTLRCDFPIEETSSEFTVNDKAKFVSTFLRKSCVSRTCVEVQRRSIMWSIGNIKKSIERQRKISYILASALKNSPSLKLTLIFNKTSSDDGIQILIKQTCLSSAEQRLFVKCKITIISAQEKYRTYSENTYLFKLNTSEVWCFPPFITTKMLMDGKYLYVDDTLFLRCEFTFSYKDRIHHLENNYMPFTFKTSKKNSELSTGFGDIYGKGQFCDVELKAGGKTFPYYKVVLCARSSVFGAMFANDMKENNSNVIKIDDVDPQTLKRMLTYMHSDVVEDLPPEAASRLYRVADKYDVESLKRRCSALLMSALSVVNVCDLLILADTHQDGLLKTAASEFICCHAGQVFHSTQWKRFMDGYPKLSSCVMHQMWIGKNQF